ncbi:MAG: transposase [Terrimicrobiaceae bacterium]|nr:transposase [Terrimicrobiaceae bacterium]
MGFAQKVWELCEPSYREASRGGRPGIDPVVYFKMLMVGFFENLPSERAIAARCEDSLSLREFLGYGLEESGRPNTAV